MAKNQPEKKFRAGAITATIWYNEGTKKTGEKTEFKTISLERSYKDKEDKWQQTGSMRVHDLPKLSLVVSKAYEYLSMKSTEVAADGEEVAEEIF